MKRKIRDRVSEGSSDGMENHLDIIKDFSLRKYAWGQESGAWNGPKVCDKHDLNQTSESGDLGMVFHMMIVA